MLELRNIRLGNTFMETFRLRIENILETFMARERFRIYLYPFLDLCASCHIQLCLFKLNLKFRNRFKVIYEYIYLLLCHHPGHTGDTRVSMQKCKKIQKNEGTNKTQLVTET